MKESAMFQLGTPELIILFVIVLLFFGAGRISKIARELGKGVSEFRAGLAKNEGETPEVQNPEA
jgi:sec-independent protein translocase protein TatA